MAESMKDIRRQRERNRATVAKRKRNRKRAAKKLTAKLARLTKKEA